MKYYCDIRFERTIDDPLQIIIEENGVAKEINKNNLNFFDASEDYIDSCFGKFELIKITEQEAKEILKNGKNYSTIASCFYIKGNHAVINNVCNNRKKRVLLCSTRRPAGKFKALCAGANCISALFCFVPENRKKQPDIIYTNSRKTFSDCF